jgi:hypothetical protein
MTKIEPEADYALDMLLGLNGRSFESDAGYVIEFSAKRVVPTKGQPHGIGYALVLRPKGGDPWVRFDNAHTVGKHGRSYTKTPDAWDHRHQNGNGPLQVYQFRDVPTLLDDFWNEVKRVLDEKGLPHDL